MRKVNSFLKFLVIFLFLWNITLFTQSLKSLDGRDYLNFEKAKQFPENIILNNLLISILKEFGKSFKYMDDILNGNYKITKDNDGFNIIFKSKNGAQEILPAKHYKGNISIDDRQLKNFLLDNNYTFKNKIHNLRSGQLIEANRMLYDREILAGPNEPAGKILNRNIVYQNTINQHNQPSILYYDVQDGTIFPFGDGTRGKIVTTDPVWGSIIYFDRDDYSSGSKSFGSFSDGEFCAPNGITYGRGSDMGSYWLYPVFIADECNYRIVKINLIIYDNPGTPAEFDKNSFIVLNNDLRSPYDVAYFSYFDSTMENYDKLWVSEINLAYPTISCLTTNGELLQRVNGYQYEVLGQTYTVLLTPGNKSRLAIYDIGFNALVFIDTYNNTLVSCLLNDEGLGDVVSYGNGYIIKANDIFSFPSEDRINSVNFLKTSELTIVWPYLYVTSGYAAPYFKSTSSKFHSFKMNKFGHTQYLGSTSLPYNTDYPFYDLNNALMINNYYDIFSIEKWSYSYGIRKYFPFADIHSEQIYQYCEDSTNQLIFNATLTNDCWIKFSAERWDSSFSSWQTVNIKSISGQEFNSNEATIFRLAGWSEGSEDLYIRIKLDLPMKDFTLGGKIKLNAKLYPEYDPSTSGEHTDTSYVINISKNCLPKPGGCPFLYVKDENTEYIPDNNVLHRMEFSEPNTNITDKYKLRIAPQINHDQIELYLVENENDVAYIDQIKVYAVDHHYSKKMGVTEDNKIVVFDSVYVNPSDSVMLNKSNITSNVNYFTYSQNLTNGYKNDSLYAHFSYIDGNKKKFNKQNSDGKKSVQTEKRAVSKENYDAGPDRNLPIAFVTNLRNLQYPIPGIKDTAGMLTATSIYSNTTSKIFARRELESEVILPLFNDTDLVDHLTINWQSDFRMKYIGMATLNYSNYTITEMPIVSGNYITITQDSSITSALTNIDANYGQVSASGFLKMKFDASQLPGITEDGVREYVIEVTGHYTNGDNNSASKIKQNIPLVYHLSQNYPNPFNPTTKINYELPLNTKVNIVIYDILGREVIRLVNNEFKHAGRYTVEFNGQNYASGVYFYRIEAGNFVQSKKMVLVK